MPSKATTLSVAQPFALKSSVLTNGWHECAPLSWCEGGRCLQLIERYGPKPYRVSIVEGPKRTDKVTLKMTIDGDSLDDKVVTLLRKRVRVVLGLDHDLTGFFALCDKHPTLHLIPKIGAGRGLRSASMTENIIKALCSTNVTWTQAVKMINRLAQLGPPVRHFVHLNAWPTPAEILRAGERYLTEVCRVGYRADSILAFCRDVSEGRFDPESLDDMAASDDVSSDDILKVLRSIHGIGPSSAHYMLSFLGRHDRISIDSATIAHVAEAHMKGRRPTNKQIEKIYAPFGRWKNMCWWYEHWLGWDTAKQILEENGLASE